MDTALSGPVFALIGALAFAGPAVAGPLLASNTILGTGGQARAVYIGSSSADTSMVSSMSGQSGLFWNGGGGVSAIGSEVVLGTFASDAEIAFSMTDMSVANTWHTGTGARNADGLVHAMVTSSLASITGLSAESYNYASTLTGAKFVGFEDRLGMQADFDYNDIVFAIISDPPLSVPEPMSLTLLGGGLIGIGLARRRAAA